MTKQSIGGVQAHSVGPFYPVIVVGYGDGTWRAEYGGVRSGPVKTAKHAKLVATAAHQCLGAFGPDACTAWLSGFSADFERVTPKPISEAAAWILEGRFVYLQLTYADGHRQVRSRAFTDKADAVRFKIAVDVLVSAKVADAVLLSLFA